MTKTSIQQIYSGRRGVVLAGFFALSLLIFGWFASVAERSAAQTVAVPVLSPAFRIGEKLSYSVSLGKFQNAGYAETYVVSRGKIGGQDAVEIRSKIKTLDLVSAAFFQFDEARTVYAAPDSCLPLYVRTNSNDSVVPKETVSDHLDQPTTNFDLLTLMFKARDAGGIGTYPLAENGNVHNVSFVTTVSEKVRTPVGDFDTQVSTVSSEYLTAQGIKELRINFSADEFRVPVLIRFKTSKGEFRATLAGIVLPEPETPAPTVTPTVAPVKTPPPVVKVTPTPDTYVDNMPLAPELGFQVGETLDYRITSAGQPIGVLTLSARERKRFNNLDSLLLTATITSVEPGVTQIKFGDSLSAQVDPETLAPTALESKFGTPYPGLNPSVVFDFRTGMIKFGAESVEAPVGTHSILSLIYAMRSFNLKPSKNLSNPVNDTRVAVFWESKAYVFTLRPSEPSEITLNGQKTMAQLITINTRNKELDALSPKVWLSPEQRVPVRFSLGAYQADLIVRNATLFR
ncbi:MAG: DUF3108 domain-containing protein [Pyrinomonadaceae bacterium]